MELRRFRMKHENDPLSEEQVEIVYNNAWGKTVCVTADSRLQAADDQRHYERGVGKAG